MNKQTNVDVKAFYLPPRYYTRKGRKAYRLSDIYWRASYNHGGTVVITIVRDNHVEQTLGQSIFSFLVFINII